MDILLASFLVVFIVSVTGHDCKDYNLSPADQSVIDMMKHYLHTSRETECRGKENKDIAVIYTRWGQKTCPENSQLVYSGQAGGNNYSNKGGGVNVLCLPSDPENGQSYSYDNDELFGAEYEFNSGNKPSMLPASLYQKEVPCAVCRRQGKATSLMIPGRKTCYKGWKSEYSGVLMSDHKSQNSKDFICMDKDAKPLDTKNGNENGAVLFPVRARCGSLRCPPYTDKTEVLCVICSK